MNNNKISAKQLSICISLVVSGMYLGLIDNILLNTAKNDAIISILIGNVIGIIFVVIFYKIFKYKPELNIYEKNKVLFKKNYKIINFFILLFQFIILIISLRSTLIFISSRYLEQTPYLFTGAFIVITILLINKNGVEAITRMYSLCFIVSVILVLLAEGLLFKYIEFDNMFPLLTSKPSSIIYSTLYFCFSSFFMVFLFLNIPMDKVSDKENIPKNFIKYYIVTSVFFSTVMFFVLTTYGMEFSSMLRYPEYMLLKKLILSNNDQHIENLISFHWLFYMLALSSISFFGVSEYFKERKKKIISPILLFTAMILSKNIFGEVIESIRFIMNYYVLLICVPFFIVILIIYIKCKRKKT